MTYPRLPSTRPYKKGGWDKVTRPYRSDDIPRIAAGCERQVSRWPMIDGLGNQCASDGPTLPTGVARSGQHPKYTERDANVLAEAAPDPSRKRTLTFQTGR